MAVVHLTGTIGRGQPFRQGLSLESCEDLLERAFEMSGAKGVALVINSPGGSPVQSHLIFNRIRDLAFENQLPVYVFIEDAAASGGYLIACAGDEIFADPSSIVGSIGVVSAGFGFQHLIEKIGIERRVYTTGPAKAMLDPFKPEKQEDIQHLRHIQAYVQRMFTELVQTRRSVRLKGSEDELFSGAFWTGEQALEKGLIDGLGDVRSIMRQRFGEKVKLKVMEASKPFFASRLLGAFQPSVMVDPDAVIQSLDNKILWQRLGL